jgi:hypothetical protein
MVKIRIACVFIMINLYATGPANARTPSSITVSSIGQSKDRSAADACRDFRPTRAQIKTYFSRAYPVDVYWSAQTYYSPCYARGTVEYADGNRGTWILKSSGIVVIQWARNGETVLFYPRNGWHDPFAGTYHDNGV